MSKPPALFSPRWWKIVRLILREWRRHRRVAKQRQNSGSLNEAATAAYRAAHDAQLARTATHHPAGPAAGDNIEAMTIRAHAALTRRGPWAPDTWIDV